MSFANRYWVIPIGFRNSSSRISPGVIIFGRFEIGGVLFGKDFIIERSSFIPWQRIRQKRHCMPHSKTWRISKLLQISFWKPCWRRASNKTRATQFERFSDRASLLNIGIRSQYSRLGSNKDLGRPAVSRPKTM